MMLGEAGLVLQITECKETEKPRGQSYGQGIHLEIEGGIDLKQSSTPFYLSHLRLLLNHSASQF